MGIELDLEFQMYVIMCVHVHVDLHVHVHVYSHVHVFIVQWSLSTRDKLGVGPLSLVEMLSSYQRYSVHCHCRLLVLCSEVVLFLGVMCTHYN